MRCVWCGHEADVYGWGEGRGYGVRCRDDDCALTVTKFGDGNVWAVPLDGPVRCLLPSWLFVGERCPA